MIEEEGERFTNVERIGEGTFSTVYKALDKTTGEWVAVKKMKMNVVGGSNGFPRDVMREVAILRELKHPNIVKLQEVKFNEGKIQLVFQHYEQDLWSYLRATPLVQP